MGLLGDKHIPHNYIMTSKEARLELLAGILDTDGHMVRGGYDLVQKNEQIAKAVVFICRSLGLAAYASYQIKSIASLDFDEWYWRVSISGDCSVIPNRDPKKTASARQQKKSVLLTGLTIEKLEKGLYFGFEIDGDRQFLLGDWQVTHNTILAMNIIQEGLIRGKRCMFVCDRKTLINQTSEVADVLGLSAHGVIAASHWRTNLRLPFQIASVQTLARRNWQEMDIVVFDEAHTLYSSSTAYIKAVAEANKLKDKKDWTYCIGLSATPFAPGLGQIYSNLINAATMAELTDSGILVPMRIFSCTKVNMEGAATAGGEWTDKAAETRGMDIIGDVVTEWIKHASTRKTIVFGATIAHCEEMARQFQEAGYKSAVFCATTTDEERKVILKDFDGPQCELRVLISVEALAKGFDVQDVECVCDVRPLRKSLSTAIQMWGRGLRSSPATGKTDCIARDTLVLTDKGEVKIQDITLDFKVWDGVNFVNHSGAICKGNRAVITYDGLTATPDHEVMTNDGWKRFKEAADGQFEIVNTGIGGHPVRFANDNIESDDWLWRISAGGGEVQPVRRNAHDAVHQYQEASRHKGVPELQCQNTGEGPRVALQPVPSSDAEVQQHVEPLLPAIRGARHKIPVRISKRRCLLDSRKYRDCRQVDAVGPDRQRRALCARKFAVGESCSEHEQHEGFEGPGDIYRVQEKSPGNKICRRNAGAVRFSGHDGRRDSGEVGREILQTEREVWDILNAGPLQRFTANGKLVHNCFLLDFSGNIIRFADDFSDVFFHGLDALDAGEKLDKAIRRDEDKEPAKCPKCGFVPCGKKCIACGFERKPAVSTVEVLPGLMQEVTLGGKKLADDCRHLYEQICTYTRSIGNPDTAKQRAWYLFAEMAGRQLPRGWDFNSTPNVPLTKNVSNRITALKKAFRKSQNG